ncbi:MAG: efflux RND transporter periplasmic adaptor subunit, partial [Myxococcales bacterium]|nr:efflux RND transporter periplasmic adaptor subunit [Myxococcales bacterium]
LSRATGHAEDPDVAVALASLAAEPLGLLAEGRWLPRSDLVNPGFWRLYGWGSMLPPTRTTAEATSVVTLADGTVVVGTRQGLVRRADGYWTWLAIDEGTVRLDDDLAAERVRDATLRSPIAGVVTRASVEVGQTLAPGMPPPFQVQDDGAYEVDIGLDEATAYAIGPDQPVEVQVSARQQLVLPGRVQTVSSTLDRQTRKAAATVRLEPTTERLLTGTTVTVVLSLEPRSGVVTVPETAVVEQGGARVVRVVGDDKAVRNVVVHPGLHQDGQVEVDGVSPGAAVVVSGPPDLADGTVVEPRS